MLKCQQASTTVYLPYACKASREICDIETSSVHQAIPASLPKTYPFCMDGSAPMTDDGLWTCSAVYRVILTSYLEMFELYRNAVLKNCLEGMEKQGLYYKMLSTAQTRQYTKYCVFLEMDKLFWLTSIRLNGSISMHYILRGLKTLVQ